MNSGSQKLAKSNTNYNGNPIAGPSNLADTSTQPIQGASHSYNTQQIHQHQRASSGSSLNSQAGMYAFSVHQPYANWPHHSHPNASPYGSTAWYPLPPHAYTHNIPLTYRENQTQTDDISSSHPLYSERSPSPPPKFRKGWDSILAAFLRNARLFRTLKGLQEDMIVINDDWERGGVQKALETMKMDLMEFSEVLDNNEQLPLKDLEERKLDCMKTPFGSEPRTPTNIIKSISRLIAQSRFRNDASNRNEFLYSAVEKRRRLNESGDSVSIPISDLLNKSPEAEVSVKNTTELTSCARTDAKPQNRDLQMKFDVAKNEDGPLRRTMKSSIADANANEYKNGVVERRSFTSIDSPVSAKKHPGLAERLNNIETHMAVRYVPSPPVSLLDRLKYLEDHIIQLEKDFPPWAALHFNQPHRGWPPPPRSRPIIVPSHLTSADHLDSPVQSSIVVPSRNDQFRVGGPSQQRKRKANTSARAKSSLHRAVLEKLEVQKAMGELGGAGSPA